MRLRSLTAAVVAVGCSFSLTACGSSDLDGKYEYIGNEGPAQIEIDGDEFSITTDGKVFSGSVDQDDKEFVLEHIGVPGDEESLDDELDEEDTENTETFSTKDEDIIYQGRVFVRVDD